jgi:carbon storage regulator
MEVCSMLILTRKVGESIFIGDDIEVAILGLDQNRVRLGIRAPSGTPILREELRARYKGSGIDARRAAPRGRKIKTEGFA